jgi:predicted nucleotidyltransferase component of viral defense system
MKKRPLKDVAASVRQRLLEKAKATNRPFQEVFQYYAMERFLYRLSQSPHGERFVLKGGLMFTLWNASGSRSTKDIDFLARTENSIEAVVPIIRAICSQSVEPDGLMFDEASIEGKLIKEDADYEGVRVKFLATLQNSRVTMQLDMGFGDVVFPGPKRTEYPVILDFPAPHVRAYSRETVVAEKLEAMVKLGQLNSRMKDFFDIWLLSRQFAFDGETLTKAVAKTFANRHTLIPDENLALIHTFADDPTKQTQWSGFLRKARIDNAPKDLPEVVEELRVFLEPVAEAARDGIVFVQKWTPPGPWKVP